MAVQRSNLGTTEKTQETPLHKPNLSTEFQKLIQLKALLDSGVLSQEEFDAEKKKILNN